MKLMTNSLVFALALAFSTGAMAAKSSISDNSYQAAKDRIEADYKSDKANCETLSGNMKDICIAEAKGKEKVAKAELEARKKNTVKNRYDVLVARAEAAYEVAKEKCDDKTGNDRDACMKEAKAEQTRAKASAEAKKKDSKAEAGK